MVNVGEAVRVCDENRKWHDGLVTAIHGWTTEEQRSEHVDRQIASYKRELDDPKSSDELKGRLHEWIEAAERMRTAPMVPSCINVVYVSSNEDKTDPNGRQIERLCSLQHESAVQNMTVPGRFYRMTDEKE